MAFLPDIIAKSADVGIDVSQIIAAVVQVLLGAIGTMVLAGLRKILKMSRDINFAFEKIRSLEEKLKCQQSQQKS